MPNMARYRCFALISQETGIIDVGNSSEKETMTPTSSPLSRNTHGENALIDMQALRDLLLRLHENTSSRPV